jgi:hypothetical protein
MRRITQKRQLGLITTKEYSEKKYLEYFAYIPKFINDTRITEGMLEPFSTLFAIFGTLFVNLDITQESFL